MAIYNQTPQGLDEARKIIGQLPDAAFAEMLEDPGRMKAIRDKADNLLKNGVVRIGTKKGTSFLRYENDRDLLNRMIVYYKARRDWTPDQQKSNIDISFFGKTDNASWLDSICEQNKINFEFSRPAAKTEQDKDAEQAAGRDAVAEHLSGKRKPLKDQPKAEIPTPKTITQPQAEPEQPQPEIGTAFLANGMQFVLYKPSEAYRKPERKAIIKDYFYDETVSLLYGQAGSYKTFWAIWEGVSFAIGKELCGLPIDADPQKILYISLEMTAKDIADRLDGMVRDMPEADQRMVEENFTIISAEDTAGMRAGGGKFLKALDALCESQHYNIVYIDSFADYVAGCDIRNETSMGDVISDLRELTYKHHLSFRIIHHGTKPTQDYDGSMAGIHTIRDLSDQVFLVKATNTKEVTITSDMQKDKSAKPRHGEAITLITKFVSEGGSFSFKRINDTETASHIEKISSVLSIIQGNEGITNGELRKIMKNPKDFSRILEGMIGNSIIQDEGRSERGQATKCYYTIEYWNKNVNTQKP